MWWVDSAYIFCLRASSHSIGTIETLPILLPMNAIYHTRRDVTIRSFFKLQPKEFWTCFCHLRGRRQTRNLASNLSECLGFGTRVASIDLVEGGPHFSGFRNDRHGTESSAGQGLEGISRRPRPVSSRSLFGRVVSYTFSLLGRRRSTTVVVFVAVVGRRILSVAVVAASLQAVIAAVGQG